MTDAERIATLEQQVREAQGERDRLRAIINDSLCPDHFAVVNDGELPDVRDCIRCLADRYEGEITDLRQQLQEAQQREAAAFNAGVEAAAVCIGKRWWNGEPSAATSAIRALKHTAPVSEEGEERK